MTIGSVVNPWIVVDGEGNEFIVLGFPEGDSSEGYFFIASTKSGSQKYVSTTGFQENYRFKRFASMTETVG